LALFGRYITWRPHIAVRFHARAGAAFVFRFLKICHFVGPSVREIIFFSAPTFSLFISTMIAVPVENHRDIPPGRMQVPREIWAALPAQYQGRSDALSLVFDSSSVHTSTITGDNSTRCRTSFVANPIEFRLFRGYSDVVSTLASFVLQLCPKATTRCSFSVVCEHDFTWSVTQGKRIRTSIISSVSDVHNGRIH
jgi:hypothetical protein